MRVYIGLGSNLDDPLSQLVTACEALTTSDAITLECRSPWYRSKAVGPEQPDYVNGVACLQTTLPPEALLDRLQEQENRQGRIRIQHWGPRTLDLDLLLYGDQTINTPRLTVPHPWLHTRNFVLQPLADIAPDLTLPNGDTVASLLSAVGTVDLQRLDI